MRILSLLLVLAACTSDDDTGVDIDTDTDPVSDDDVVYPTTKGFEFDGGWYPVSEDGVSCQAVTNLYRFTGSGVRDVGGQDGTVRVYFLNLPEPGSYEVVAYTFGVQPYPGTVGLEIADERDQSFWYSDGEGGTLDVVSVGGLAVDVVWHDVAVSSTTGNDTMSDEGWLRCSP